MLDQLVSCAPRNFKKMLLGIIWKFALSLSRLPQLWQRIMRRGHCRAGTHFSHGDTRTVHCECLSASFRLLHGVRMQPYAQYLYHPPVVGDSEKRECEFFPLEFLP